MLAYRGFDVRGFRIVAVFDADRNKIGKKMASLMIQPLTALEKTIAAQSIRLAILAVPAEHAEEVANRLVEAGIRGILNFAPVTLTLPPKVAVNSVDVAVQLEQLSFHVNFPALEPSGQS